MKTLDEMVASIKSRDLVACPHCGHGADMTAGENYVGHVTYWGEVEAKPTTCSSCGTDFYLKEYVTRHWVSGRTPDEAAEI